MFRILTIAAIFCAAISTKSFAQTTTTAKAETTVAAKDTTVTMKVKGITCPSDLITLSDNVKGLKGVSVCKAGKAGPTTSFTISFDPSLVDTQKIIAALEDTEGCKNPNDRPYKVRTK